MSTDEHGWSRPKELWLANRNGLWPKPKRGYANSGAASFTWVLLNTGKSSDERRYSGNQASFAIFSKWLFTHSVVMDLGRSSGKPSARDQHRAESTPSARDTPNSTV